MPKSRSSTRSLHHPHRPGGSRVVSRRSALGSDWLEDEVRGRRFACAIRSACIAVTGTRAGSHATKLTIRGQTATLGYTICRQTVRSLCDYRGPHVSAV